MKLTPVQTAGLFLALPLAIAIFCTQIYSPIKPAEAAAGDIRVTVTREADDSPIEGALVEIRCLGGATPSGGYLPLAGSPLTNASGVVVGAPDAGAGCDEEDSLAVRVIADGYVSANNENGFIQFWSSTADPNEVFFTGVQFGFAVLVNDELGNPHDTLDQILFDGEAPTLQSPGQSNLFFWASTDAHSALLSIQKDGYVSSETTNAGMNSIDTAPDSQLLINLGTADICPSPINGTGGDCKGLQFGYRVNILNELDQEMSEVTVSTSNGENSCIEFGDYWYCIVKLNEDDTNNFLAVKDGYVTFDSSSLLFGESRLSVTDPQMDRDFRLNFSYVISSITAEGTETDLTATAEVVQVGDTGQAICEFSGGNWYCPVTLIDSDGTMRARFDQDGYVSKTTYTLLNNTQRLSDTDGQVNEQIENIQYAVKVNVSKTADNSAMSDATVVVGDGLATGCEEGDATGMYGTYFCALLVGETGTIAEARKSGYISASDTYIDRTIAVNPQRVVSLALTAFASEGGSNNNTGNEEDPTPEPTPSPEPISAPSSAPSKDLSTLIGEEKNVVLDLDRLLANIGRERSIACEQEALQKYLPELMAGLRGYSDTDRFNVANFICYGTGTTEKIGAGERAAALASYKDAYGKLPKTNFEWQDVLNIANGRWPLEINKAAEAGAIASFRTIYDRLPRSTDSVEQNALKMLAYGVRAAPPRNLIAESQGITEFRKLFGVLPSLAKHWNIVRTIVYSGLR